MIYTACEKAGIWPSQWDTVLIVLLVKKDGGFRPIGIFMSPIRIYAKARFDLARCWEENHPRPCLYGGPSRGAQRASWIASFTAEHAGLG